MSTVSPAVGGTLFDDTTEAGDDREFTLWFRATHGRAGWEPVTCGSEYACVNAIGTGGRSGGRWCVLPADQEP